MSSDNLPRQGPQRPRAQASQEREADSPSDHAPSNRSLHQSASTLPSVYLEPAGSVIAIIINPGSVIEIETTGAGPSGSRTTSPISISSTSDSQDAQDPLRQVPPSERQLPALVPGSSIEALAQVASHILEAEAETVAQMAAQVDEGPAVQAYEGPAVQADEGPAVQAVEQNNVARVEIVDNENQYLEAIEPPIVENGRRPHRRLWRRRRGGRRAGGRPRPYYYGGYHNGDGIHFQF